MNPDAAVVDILHVGAYHAIPKDFYAMQATFAERCEFADQPGMI